MMDLETIFNSLVNGQRFQFTEQVDQFCQENNLGIGDFWEFYKGYLENVVQASLSAQYTGFTNAVITYHKIDQ